MFADKLKEFKEEQTEIRMKLAQYDKADEKFYITANVVLNMVRFALDIFKSSETSEQRQMLNFLFQNFQLNGKKLDYTLREPFDSVSKYANCPTLLPIKNAFRTIDWSIVKQELEPFIVFMSQKRGSFSKLA